MKFLKTFENFYLPSDMETDEQDYLMRDKKMQNVVKPDDDDEYCEPCEDDEMGSELPSFDEDDDMRMSDFEDDNDMGKSHIMRFEAKKAKPDFLDLDKDGDKKESMKKAAKDAKEGKKGGLTAAQKKLPEGLRKAIEARKKK